MSDDLFAWIFGAFLLGCLIYGLVLTALGIRELSDE